MCVAKKNTRPEAATLAELNTPGQPYTTDSRSLRPLNRSIAGVLPLTAKEQQRCRVMALSSQYHTEETPQALCLPRFAVCSLVPRADWATLTPGDTILYTELYQYSESDGPFPAEQTANGLPRELCDHVGTVRVYDAKRGLLYASSWDGGIDNELDFGPDEMHEIWLIKRFIAAPVLSLA